MRHKDAIIVPLNLFAVGVTDKLVRRWAQKRGFYLGPVSDMASVINPNRIDFGVEVSTDAALRFTAVYSAIKILAENIASLPKFIKRQTDDGYVDAPEHPAYKVLSIRPNEYTDTFAFWFSIISWMESKGNAFAAIEFDGKGQPVALHQINPSFVRIEIINGRKTYTVRHASPDFAFLNRTYMDYEMLHFMMYSTDGIAGIDPISYNATAIGRGIATQKFSADFYKKGGQIKGTLETEGSFDDVGYKAFMEHYKDSSTNFGTPLLEYGVKYKTIGITPIAAQLIQSETLSIQDIARIFGVPLHMLAELSHATFSNIEHQNIQFATYTLRPLCKRLEQQLELKLFTDYDRNNYDVKFDLRGIMRGDNVSRANYYSSAINAGWMTPNEARDLEGMTRLDGLDSPRIPLNTAVVGEGGKIVTVNNQE